MILLIIVITQSGLLVLKWVAKITQFIGIDQYVFT